MIDTSDLLSLKEKVDKMSNEEVFHILSFIGELKFKKESSMFIITEDAIIFNKKKFDSPLDIFVMLGELIMTQSDNEFQNDNKLN